MVLNIYVSFLVSFFFPPSKVTRQLSETRIHERSALVVEVGVLGSAVVVGVAWRCSGAVPVLPTTDCGGFSSLLQKWRRGSWTLTR